MTLDIELPWKWDPRPYQLDAWNYLDNGGKRAALIWHRRAGKDDLALRWTSVAATQRVGNYWHMLPQANQARKALWDAVNPHSGKRRVDEAFPARDPCQDARKRDVYPFHQRVDMAGGRQRQFRRSDRLPAGRPGVLRIRRRRPAGVADAAADSAGKRGVGYFSIHSARREPRLEPAADSSRRAGLAPERADGRRHRAVHAESSWIPSYGS